MICSRACLALLLIAAAPAAGLADDAPRMSRLHRAADTVRFDPAGEANPAARAMLADLAWEPAAFRFAVTAVTAADGRGGRATASVQFPSPRPDPEADAAFNTVHMDWYAAEPSPAAAPAVLLLHIMHNDMPVSHALGRSFAARGVHAFVMHMPGFGSRRVGPFDAARFFAHASQAVADARRARDAIAALPGVDASRIALVGTSLGGFIAAPVAAIDNAFHRTFILLAGGEIAHMLSAGRNEAQRVREHLERAGYRGQRLLDLCARLEPTTLAHRLDPAATWMLNTTADQVVPRRCSDALARAARLPADHHLHLAGDHYLGVIHMPWIAGFILEHVAAGATASPPPAPRR